MTTNPKTELHQALLSHLEETLDIVQGVMRAHPEYDNLSPLRDILVGTIKILSQTGGTNQ